MLIGKRESHANGRRRNRAFSLTTEVLEGRQLLSTVQLDLSSPLANSNSRAITLPNVMGNPTATNTPPATTPLGPFGVQEVGAVPNAGAGWSVSDVGDVNGDGYDDFVVGAPTVGRNADGSVGVAGGTTSRDFLVFGSQSVNAGTIDFATLTSEGRGGDLGLLGNSTQTNPFDPLYAQSISPTTPPAPLSIGGGFPYNGLTFYTGSNPNSRLGSFVKALGDVNGDGYADFMLGAPGALSLDGTFTAGRAYVVYGNATIDKTVSKIIDLDNSLSVGAVANVITYGTNQGLLAGAQIGAGGGGVGDVITDGFPDIAIAAPTASTPTGLSQTGEVFLISGTTLRTSRTTTIDVSTIGQNGDTSGIVFTGAASGDLAGFSVATAGNFDGQVTSANQAIDDLLIGSPQTGFGSGKAYLIYGGTPGGSNSLFSRVVTTNGFSSINLSRIGDPTTTNNLVTGNVAGAVFTGALASTAAEDIGYAVSTAGNFTSSNATDILIGAPRALGTAGRIDLIKGQSSLHFLLGTVYLDPLFATNPNTNLLPSQAIEFDGEGTGALAGWSLTAVGRIANVGLPHNEIAIGSPGLTGANGPGSGAVYVIVGGTGLSGIQQLSTAATNLGIKIIATSPVGSAQTLSAPFLGASVSSTNVLAGQTKKTTDADQLGDLIIGAPGYSLATFNVTPATSSRRSAGTVYALEGTFLQSAINTSGSNGGGGGGSGGGGGISFGGVGAGLPPGFQVPTTFLPPLGERLFPTLGQLHQENSYQPIALSVATNQFLPLPAYIARNNTYDSKPSHSAHGRTDPNALIVKFGHQKSGLNYRVPRDPINSSHYAAGRGAQTLGSHIFNRGVYHPGKTIKVHHKVAVFPVNRQNDVYR